jgi:hypothetical protein
MFAHVPRKNEGVNGQTKRSSLRLPCIDSLPDEMVSSGASYCQRRDAVNNILFALIDLHLITCFATTEQGDVLPRSTPGLHRVLKFGGSSVGSAEKLGQVVN